MNDPLHTTKPPDQTQAVPVPPRYWWLKRIVLASALLITVLGVVRWRWGVYARNALQAEINSYIAAGQPVYEADFLGPPVPDGQNAAVLLRKAAQRFDALKQMQPGLGQISDIRDSLDRDEARAQMIMDASAEMRSLARQAARMPNIEWNADLQIGRVDGVLDLLALDALVRHRKGNDEEALAILCDLVRCSRHAGSHRSLLGALVYAAGVRRTAEALEQILPGISIRSEAGVHQHGATDHFVDRRPIQDLIKLLVDDRLQKSFVRGLYRERAFQVSALGMVCGDPTLLFAQTPGRAGSLIMPMVQLDGVRVLKHHSAMVQAMAGPNLPACQRKLPARPDYRLASIKGVTRFFSLFVMPDLNGPPTKAWHSIAIQRMAAVALAVRLYEADHGSPPHDLNELVPGYLPCLPENPLGDRPFQLERGDRWTRILAVNQVTTRENAWFYLKGKPLKLSATNPGVSKRRSPATATRPQ